ncbi:TPA: hypothetical protein NIF41_006024 [Pseudomonas aeruginosa]|nr:hypothetical protein IPC694_27135 [Pseudomonas aeruginosa]WCW22503.1 hypothetical protein KK183_22125 [Pseudomonas aeruginosa]WCW22512.1 hypothetical protein KK183_24500 [Pseudomonas aeruginosa]WCW22513.1 hypothetical protein KK183_24580 [Pseudomonas aeruginosa]HBO3177789.1 hypothetical protein [Pseudomonas aeruginosa]
MALAVTAIHDREELKKEASLREIQEMYFRFIEENFGHFFKTMIQKNLSPHDIASAVSNTEASTQEITKNLDQLLNVIDQFWEGLGEIAHIHAEDMHGNIKGVFGGDLFPSHKENIASKCGIYTDTIILPDPFLRSKHIFQFHSQADKAYYLVKHALNLLQYKDLVCADTEIPIVIVLPDLSMLQEEEHKFYQILGKEDSLIHSGKLFGRNFESLEELLDFCNSLDTIERAVAEIADKTRVLFDTDWDDDVASQIARAMKSDHMKPLGQITPGFALATQSVGRMSVSNEILIKARRLNGTPIIDAPTSWQYLVWKMEYDANRAESALKSKDLHIIKGLSELARSDMEWIGNIPPDALIEIRRQGAMDEIREILGSGITEIIESNPKNFYRSKDRIFDNIELAFKDHQKKLLELKGKNWKFAGKDIGSWLVVGSLEVAAAVTGLPVWGMATIAADQLLDVPKLKDIPKSIRELADENNRVKKSPVGMLFNIRKKVH